MKRMIVVGSLIACLTLQGCSSKPREFTPIVGPATASQAEFDAAYGTCQQLLVAGKLDSSGRSGSAGAGVAAGAATAAAGSTAAAAVGGYAGLAAASATIVLLPFAIVGGAWGMSKMKRAKKERAIKIAMEGCLKERGYQVAGWTKGVKKPVVVQQGTASR
jgi:outer membrane lipoprotein SlyB